MELAKLAMTGLVQFIFADTAFSGLFHKLYCSSEWTGGNTTASILATLQDFLKDYEEWVEATSFKR